jgi:hypothetical protein
MSSGGGRAEDCTACGAGPSGDVMDDNVIHLQRASAVNLSHSKCEIPKAWSQESSVQRRQLHPVAQELSGRGMFGQCNDSGN